MADLKEQLFPDGQPEPDEFIGAIVELVRARLQGAGTESRERGSIRNDQREW